MIRVIGCLFSLPCAGLSLAFGILFSLGGHEMGLFESGEEDVKVAAVVFSRPVLKLDSRGTRIVVS